MNFERSKKRDAGWFQPVIDLTNETSSKKICLQSKKPRRVSKNENHKAAEDANTKLNENVFSNNWIEKFGPTDVSELAVNAKKIDEIRTWIQIAVNNKTCPNSMLLLTGPSGSGKTTTVQIIVKNLKADLSEWITPADAGNYFDRDDFINSNYEKQSTKFSNFLLKSSCYPSLLSSSNTPRVVLVEDYPNFLMKDTSEFSEILQKYRDKGKSPLIFICSDNNAGSFNMAWKLFPPSTIEKFNIHQISFNAVSTTNMKAALKRITTAMGKTHSSLYNIPNQESIDSIINSSMGDIRSAINNLSITALKNSQNIQFQNVKSIRFNQKKTKTKKDNTQKINGIGKDENISVMHGVGRVLNPKLADKINDGDKEALTHSPFDIADQFQSLPSLFVGYINENYLPHFSHVQHVEEASKSLSDADCLLNEWKVKDSKLFGLLVAISGVMLANKSPVSSWHPIKGQKNMTIQYPDISEFPLLEQNQLIRGKTLSTDYKTYYNIIKTNKVSESHGIDEEITIEDVF